MNEFKDDPVFAPPGPVSMPLSSAELQEVRRLIARERRRRDLTAPGVFASIPQARINHADLAERIYRARRNREQIFEDDIFADPAWDIMLDLFIRSQRNEQVSISSACHAACVPEATALRHLNALTEKDYVVRISHATDRRSTMLMMTPAAAGLMKTWLSAFAADQ